MNENIIDETTKVVTEEGVSEETVAAVDSTKTGETSTEVSTEQATAAKEELQGLLDDHGYDSIDDLQAAIKAGASLSGLIGDRDAAEMVQKAETLDRYEAHWAEQRETQARVSRQSEEDPDETILRLERELRAEKHVAQQRDIRDKTVDADRKAVTGYNELIAVEVSKASGLSEKDQKFLENRLRVNHASQVQGTVVDARKMIKSEITNFSALKQSHIRDYLDGKAEVTSVGETDTVAAPASEKPKQIMSLKEAKTAMLEKLGIK